MFLLIILRTILHFCLQIKLSTINKGFLQNGEINYKLDKHMVLSFTVTIIHKIFTVLIVPLHTSARKQYCTFKYGIFLTFFFLNQKFCTPEKNAALCFSAFYNLVKLHNLTFFLSATINTLPDLFPCLVPRKHTKV